MIGERIPAGFLVYVAFKDQPTICMGGDEDFQLRVRTYHEEIKGRKIIIRIDTFRNRKLIAHYMPSLQILFHLDKKGVIDRVVQMERYFPVQHCEAGRMK
jgi:hypothetical protein